MPKATIGFSLRITEDLYEAVKFTKGDLSFTKLIDLLLRAYVEGRIRLTEEEKK